MTAFPASYMQSSNEIESICEMIRELSQEVTQETDFPSVFQNKQRIFTDLSYQLIDAIPIESEELLRNAFFLLSHIEAMNQKATFRHKQIDVNKFTLEFEVPSNLKSTINEISFLANRILQLNQKIETPEISIEIDLEILHNLFAQELASTIGFLKTIAHKAAKPLNEPTPIFFTKLDGPQPINRLKAELKENLSTVLTDTSQRAILKSEILGNDLQKILNKINDILRSEFRTAPHTILKICRETNKLLEKFVANLSSETPIIKEQDPCSRDQASLTRNLFGIPLDYSSKAETSTLQLNPKKNHWRKLSEEYDSIADIPDLHESAIISNSNHKTTNNLSEMDLSFQSMLNILAEEPPLQPCYKNLCRDAIKSADFKQLEKLFEEPNFLNLNLEELFEINEQIPLRESNKAIIEKVRMRINQVLQSSDICSAPLNHASSRKSIRNDDDEKTDSQQQAHKPRLSSLPNEWQVVPEFPNISGSRPNENQSQQKNLKKNELD